MFADIVKAAKEGLAHYQRVTPLMQKLTRAFAFCAGGLVCIIVPDVLTAFGVTVAWGKDVLFSIYGGALFGLGLGQLLFPMFFSQIPERQSRQQQHAAPDTGVENEPDQQRGAKGDSFRP